MSNVKLEITLNHKHPEEGSFFVKLGLRMFAHCNQIVFRIFVHVPKLTSKFKAQGGSFFKFSITKVDGQNPTFKNHIETTIAINDFMDISLCE